MINYIQLNTQYTTHIVLLNIEKWTMLLQLYSSIVHYYRVFVLLTDVHHQTKIGK